MTLRNSVVISAVLGCCLYGGPSSAHHPTAANYDTSNVVTLRGVAAKIVFGAPHTYLWLDVQDAGSQVTHWVVELDAQAKVGAAGFTDESPPLKCHDDNDVPRKARRQLVAAIPSAQRRCTKPPRRGGSCTESSLHCRTGTRSSSAT
jgi:hypothetical protein